MKRFNREGGPVPAVDPSALEQVWQAMQRMEADTSSRPKTMGLGAYAGYGVDISRFGPGTVHQVAVVLRVLLLSSLFHRGVLRDYLFGDKLKEEVFRSAATIPCDKEEFGEAVTLLNLSQSPEDIAAKGMERLRAEGYDPEKPKIDSKFLAWVRAHTEFSA
jgi:hypothetical protein